MLPFLCYWVHLATYWGMVVLFDFAKDGPPTLDRKDYARVARAALWNQIFLTLPLGWLGLSILMYPMTPSDAQQAYDLPWLAVVILLSDIYFYLTHRLLHTRWLWHLHKSHHHGELAVAKALDAGCIEHVGCNLGAWIFPFVFLQVLTGRRPAPMLLGTWTVLATWSTCASHAKQRGVHGDKGFHAVHHANRNANFGVGFYAMDKFLGTFKSS